MSLELRDVACFVRGERIIATSRPPKTRVLYVYSTDPSSLFDGSEILVGF